MPFTFLAHQAPVLPIARRWPGLVDGPALVVGSMAPDFAYVLTGSRFAVWAHGMPGLVLFCVPATIVAAWIIVRVMAPVVPVHLPDGGHFRVHDLRGLAVHRFRALPTVLGALLGAIIHVALDSFTHDWGWFARNLSWYRRPLVDATWLGEDWTVYRLVQYVGHVGGTLLCLWLLWSYGQDRWMTDRARMVDAPSPTLRSQLVLWGCTSAGLACGLIWVGVDSARIASDVLRLAGTTFAGMTVGAIAVRSSRRHVTVTTSDSNRDT